MTFFSLLMRHFKGVFPGISQRSILTPLLFKIQLTTFFFLLMRHFKEIFPGVPQRSILMPLLFKIYINDIFLFVDEAFLSNYVDDTAFYSKKPHLSSICS